MNKYKKGFTLIELITVIAVIGILVLLAVPKFIGYVDKSQLARIKYDVKVAENIADAELTLNNKYPDIWKNVNYDELIKLTKENKTYDIKGLLEDRVIDEGEYVMLSKGASNSKLKGNFYANQGGIVYYILEDNIKNPKVIHKTMKIIFELSKTRNLSKIIDIPNVESVNIKTINNGSADVEISGTNKIKLNVNNGVGEIVQTGTYTPSESKKVTNQDYPIYDSDGFIGNLTKYVHSGHYDRKRVAVYFTGNLKDFNIEYEWDSQTNSWILKGNPTLDVYTPGMMYNKDGYEGPLFLSKTATQKEIDFALSESKPKNDGNEDGEIFKPNIKFKITYDGWVSTDDTRIYKYEGIVTKPEIDTRKSETFYKYEVEIEYTIVN